MKQKKRKKQRLRVRSMLLRSHSCSRRDSGGVRGGDDNDNGVARGGCVDRRFPAAVYKVWRRRW
jgi:hypothetical protein